MQAKAKTASFSLAIVLFLATAAWGQMIEPSPQSAQATRLRSRAHNTYARIAPTVTCGTGTNNWVGAGGDNQWATATNWSKGTVPVSSDNVCIPSTVTRAITIQSLGSNNQTIASLTSGAPITMANGPLTISGSATFADLAITAGTFTLNGTSSLTTLEQSAGTLTGSGTVTVSGLLTWSGGTESGTGTTNANGGMTITGQPSLDTRTMNNAKTATWNGTAFLLFNGSVFNNKTGATWNHENDSLIAWGGGSTPPTFNNAGTFEKTAGTDSTGGGLANLITFNNTGSVLSSSGILLVDNNGVCSGTCAGSWSVSSGTTLQLGGAGTAGALSGPISGAGTVVFASGTVNYTGTYNVTGGTQATSGTANFTSPATLTNVGPITITNGTLNFTTGKTITTTTLTQSAGTLTGSDTVTVSGLLTWSGGTESGTGTTNANGRMTITGQPSLDTRTMNNAKTATWNGTAFLLFNGSVFNNKTGATWNHENDSLIAWGGGSTPPTFNNAGTFEKTAGTDSTGGGLANLITFNNTGSVLSSSGILLVDNNGVCSGTCAGSWSVSSGTTLQLGGAGTAGALSGPISGAGTVVFASGTVNYTGTYNVTGGTQATSGTANFTSPATLTNVGPITITNGTLNFTTGKTITTTTLTQSAGTLTGSDTVTVSGLLTWSGGTESGTGTTNANGGMTITGQPSLDTRTMNNAKTATWNGTAFLLFNGSVFNNKTGATWNHENDSLIAWGGGSTPPTFNNAGTFEKTGGTGTSGGGVSGNVNFSNSGAVIAKSGILLVGQFYMQTLGSTLLEGGNISTGGSNTATINGGSLLGAGAITGGLTNTSGIVGPSLNSTVTGTLNINGAGTGYYTQGSAGTLLFDMAGSSAGQFDVLAATGTATLAGSAQLCLIKGFKPIVGATFPIMSYASETGNFSTVNFGWSLTVGSTSTTATYNGAPATSYSPTSLAFPSTLVKIASAPLTVTLSNPGGVALTISSVNITGTNASDYAITTNTCASSLAVGSKCTMTVTFTPAAVGSRTASIVVADNACMSPQKIALSGKGTELTLSPSPVAFGSQAVGTTSAPLTVTVTNHGTTAVTATGATITGTNKTDFAIASNGCKTIVANGGSCTITVSFTPSATGARTGTLSLTDNDKGSPQTDVLSGTGQ